jgi:hypothetical protein
MTQQTTQQTIDRTLRYGQGYTGKLGARCYAARITGTDSRYGLARQFVEPTNVEREHYRRARTMVECTYALVADGLYELSAEGERWIVGVLPQQDGTLRICRLGDARIKAWIAALDAGLAPEEARRASRAVTT